MPVANDHLNPFLYFFVKMMCARERHLLKKKPLIRNLDQRQLCCLLSFNISFHQALSVGFGPKARRSVGYLGGVVKMVWQPPLNDRRQNAVV